MIYSTDLRDGVREIAKAIKSLKRHEHTWGDIHEVITGKNEIKFFYQECLGCNKRRKVG
jgi:hypothetical protein